MASFIIKIFFVFAAMTLLSSCSNKEDALIGGKYQENLKKLDEITTIMKSIKNG